MGAIIFPQGKEVKFLLQGKEVKSLITLISSNGADRYKVHLKEGKQEMIVFLKNTIYYFHPLRVTIAVRTKHLLVEVNIMFPNAKH